MQSTEFFLNGYRVNGGDVLSFSITNKMAMEAIELQKSLNGKDMIARIQVEDHTWFILVDSITTSPIEDLSAIEEEDEVVEIMVGNRDDYLPGWNSLVEARIKEQEKRDAVRGAWDRINLETDVVPYLRGYFHTDDMTTTSGKRVSGRPFIRYRLNVVGDFVFTYTSTFVETEFLVNSEYHDFSKLSSILESWAAVENLQYNIEEANKRLAPCGARLYGTYGILDNTLRLKVEDTQYGTDCGFENRIFVKYGNKVDAYICNRLLNLSGLEEIITSLAEKLNTNIPPLVEVLK